MTAASRSRWGCRRCTGGGNGIGDGREVPGQGAAEDDPPEQRRNEQPPRVNQRHGQQDIGNDEMKVTQNREKVGLSQQGLAVSESNATEPLEQKAQKDEANCQCHLGIGVCHRDHGAAARVGWGICEVTVRVWRFLHWCGCSNDLQRPRDESRVFPTSA